MSMRGQIWTGKIAFCALVLSVQPSAATYSKIQIWMQQAAVLLIFAGSDWSHVPKPRYGRSRWCNRHRIDQNGSASNIPTPVCRIFFLVCVWSLEGLLLVFTTFNPILAKHANFYALWGLNFARPLFNTCFILWSNQFHPSHTFRFFEAARCTVLRTFCTPSLKLFHVTMAVNGMQHTKEHSKASCSHNIHYITLHDIWLYYTILCCIILCYIILYYIILCYCTL